MPTGKITAVKEETDDNYSDLIDEEKYRRIKREHDLEDKLVAPVGLLTEALLKAAAQIITIMDSLPLNMERMNPRLTGHDIQLVKKSIAKCRNVITDVKIDLEG